MPFPFYLFYLHFLSLFSNSLFFFYFTYFSLAVFVYVSFFIYAYARRIVRRLISLTAHAIFVLDALVQPSIIFYPPIASRSYITATAATNTSLSCT